MKPYIRKLNIEDIELLKAIDNCETRILVDELESNEETTYLYEPYGIFLSESELIGCCALTNSYDYTTYQYWNSENSKAITELWIKDDYIDEEENKDKYDLCLDLLDYILNQDSNKDYNIYYDNNMNLYKEKIDKMGFITLYDGILLKPNNETKETNKL